MIRNERQYQAARKTRDDIIRIFKSRETCSEDARLMDDHLCHLNAEIREYEYVKDRSLAKNVFPVCQLETGARQYSQSLFLLRKFADRSQKQMADALGTTQGYIAELEHPDRESHQVDLVERWATECDYEFSGFFVRRGEYNTSAAIDRLGIEAAMLQSFFGGSSQHVSQMLRIFLDRLRDVTSVDILTCYLIDPNSQLSLFHSAGVRDRSRMGGLVKRSNVPLDFMHGSLQYIPDVSKEIRLQSSSFVQREGVRSEFCIPLRRCTSVNGIIFLNFRRLIEEPTQDFCASLEQVPLLIELLLSKVPDYDILFGKDVGEGSVKMRIAQAIQKMQPLALEGLTAAERCIQDTIHLLGLKSNATYVLYLQDEDKLVPRYCFPRTAMQHHAIDLCDSGSIVARAANDNTYTIAEDGSSLASPIRVEGKEGEMSVGAVLIDGADPHELTTEHARFIEAHSQAISTILQTSNLWIVGAKSQRNKSVKLEQGIRNQVIALFDAIQPQSDKASKTLPLLAELALNLFGCSSVDIWPFDWKEQRFVTEDGVRKSTEQWQHRVQAANLDPRPNGNSRQLIEHCVGHQMLIRNAHRDHSVSPETVNLRFKTLLGQQVYGPESARAEGVMWLRFENQLEDEQEKQLCFDADVFGKFIHLLWNPVVYPVHFSQIGASRE
ncbi:MAG: hypothetical protein ACYC6N_04990 [Pirellulaceae bacterium]